MKSQLMRLFPFVLIITVGILVAPLMFIVHLSLDYCCLLYARKFCTKRGYKLRRHRWGPAFNDKGIKTEFTIVELDRLDAQGERRLVRLLIWLFGIRKVLLDEKYPESCDETAWRSKPDSASRNQ